MISCIASWFLGWNVIFHEVHPVMCSRWKALWSLKSNSSFMGSWDDRSRVESLWFVLFFLRSGLVQEGIEKRLHCTVKTCLISRCGKARMWLQMRQTKANCPSLAHFALALHNLSEKTRLMVWRNWTAHSAHVFKETKETMQKHQDLVGWSPALS